MLIDGRVKNVRTKSTAEDEGNVKHITTVTATYGPFHLQGKSGGLIHYAKPHTIGETICGIEKPFHYWYDVGRKKVTCEECIPKSGTRPRP